MVEHYSEDSNHMEKLMEFDKHLRESTDKSQRVKDYEGIIEFSKMSIETKELGAKLIPQYFQFYTSHSKQAFDAFTDIIQAVGLMVRVQAIYKLPLFCKYAPEFVSDIIDVLLQCLETDQHQQLDAVHETFVSLFQQKTLPDLITMVRVEAIRKLPLFCKDTPEFVSDIIDVLVLCLDTDQQKKLDAVHETFTSLFQQETLPNLIKKSLRSVDGVEMKFLTSLSRFGVKAPQKRIKELVELVEGQVDWEAKTLNIPNADCVVRLIPYLQAALPFSVRGGPDRKFLNFLKNHIMPDFDDKLPEQMKLDLLKALAEISPHTATLDALQMLPSIVQLLKKYTEKSDSRYVECLLYTFHHMAHKVPNATNRLCGYKFVMPSDRIGDDFSKLYKEFTQRLTNLEELIKASMEQLVQEMSDHDKANLESTFMSGDEEANLYTSRQDTKTKIRSCINILAMTEVLHAEAPSLIGDTSVVKLSWKEATKPVAYSRPISELGSRLYTYPPNMEALENLMEHLPVDVLYELDEKGICELEDAHVEALVGLSGLKLAQDTLPDTRFTLYDDPELACIFWKINKSKLLKLLTTKSWKVVLGYIRNQLYHLLCWAYVACDLVSAMRIIRNWEVGYLPLCPWYLCSFCRPEKLGRDEKAMEGHICYGNSVEDSLLYIKEYGIPLEVCKEFDCEDWEPPNADEPQMHKRRIKSVRFIESMEEALLQLPNFPIAADLVVFPDALFRAGEKNYDGAVPNSSGLCSYHGVIISAIEEYDGEVVAICKLCNGTGVGYQGYLRVSLATMYMVVGVCPEKKHWIRGTPKPMHLLSNFVIIDIDENPEGKPKENQEQTPEENQEHKQYPDFNASRSKFHNFLNKHIMPDSDKVRVQAIRKLPLFCEDTPELVSDIIDVLVQCLDTDQQEQLDAVHEAFMSLFQQDTKASLTALFKYTEATLTTDDQVRVKVLHYIRDKVLPLKGELLKPQEEEMERHINDLIKKAETPSFIRDTYHRGKRPADGASNDVNAKKARQSSSGCDQGI